MSKSILVLDNHKKKKRFSLVKLYPRILSLFMIAVKNKREARVVLRITIGKFIGDLSMCYTISVYSSSSSLHVAVRTVSSHRKQVPQWFSKLHRINGPSRFRLKNLQKQKSQKKKNK